MILACKKDTVVWGKNKRGEGQEMTEDKKKEMLKMSQPRDFSVNSIAF